MAGAAAYWLPSAALVSRAARSLFGVHATTRGGGVALTFDDGPHPRGTPAVLAELERLGLPAVFFLAGEQVARYPAVARAIVAAGHEVGLHCQRHRNLMRLAPRQVRDDLCEAFDRIATVTERPIRLYRPPYGILTTPALVTARRLGCEVVLWRRDGHDWEAAATPQSIGDRILRRVLPGDVVLLHDADHYSAPGSWANTLGSLELIASGLAERDLRATALDVSR